MKTLLTILSLVVALSSCENTQEKAFKNEEAELAKLQHKQAILLKIKNRILEINAQTDSLDIISTKRYLQLLTHTQFLANAIKTFNDQKTGKIHLTTAKLIDLKVKADSVIALEKILDMQDSIRKNLNCQLDIEFDSLKLAARNL